MNACGNSGVSRLRVTPTTGGGGGQQQRIMAYPNPAQNVLVIENISTSASSSEIVSSESIIEDFSATLFNSQNQEVKYGKSKKGKISFDLHDLRNGFYYLNIQRGKSSLPSRYK